MSYTTSFEGFSFIHNSDWSGEVDIVNTVTKQRMSVPGNVLLSFAAEFIRNREISRWENMDSDEILGVDT